MNGNDLLMLIITQSHSAGKPNPQACSTSFLYRVPICAPTPTGGQMRSSSPQSVIVPSRFCKFGLPTPLSSAVYLLRLITQDIWGTGGQDLQPYYRLTEIL